jgi:hypothetical protein
MTYEHLFGDVVGSKHSLIARVVYSTLPASFTKDGDRYPSLVDAGNEQYTTVESATKHTIEVSYNIVSLELMYKFNVVGNLGLTAGPTFDFPIKKTLDQRYEITEPDNVQFKQVDLTQPQYQGYKYENNDRTLVVYSGDIPDAAGFRFALKAGIQYEIIMKGRWYVVPSVYYNLGLTNIGKKDAKTESWKVSAFQAGVDVRFAL